MQDEKLRDILKNHAKSLIEYLLEKNEPFGVLAKTDQIDFNPDIPIEVKNSFGEFALFLLINYTLESAYIKEEDLVFEAGFGSENIGSIVTVPIESILQIVVDKTPIFVNITATTIWQKKEKNGIKNSMEALLSNPENQKFLKKRKK